MSDVYNNTVPNKSPEPQSDTGAKTQNAMSEEDSLVLANQNLLNSIHESIGILLALIGILITLLSGFGVWLLNHYRNEFKIARDEAKYHSNKKRNPLFR